MDITRYEEITGKIVPEEQRTVIMQRIASASVHVNRVCGGQFTNTAIIDGEVIQTIKFPVDVEYGITKLVEEMGSTSKGVASYSLEGMSKSFFQGAEYVAAAAYWRPYARKLRVY